MLRRPEQIRSLWPLPGRDGPRPLSGSASCWISAGGTVVENATPPAGAAFGLVRWRGRSYLVVPEGTGARVRLRGEPVPGGVAPLAHGDVVSAGSGPARRKWWLSREGPAAAEVLDAPATDAFTFEELPAGSPAVRCGCEAVYALDAWTSLRRCPFCNYAEDGAYRLPPPDSDSGGSAS